MKNSEENISALKPAIDWRHLNADVVARYTILLLVVLVPLAMHLGMNDTFDLPKWTILYLGTLVLAGCWFVRLAGSIEIKIVHTPLDWPILFLLAVMTISTFQSIDKPLSIFGYYKIYTFGLIPTFFTFLLYWLTAQLFANVSHDDSIILNAAVFAGALIALYGILQYFGIEIFERMPSAEGTRVWSTMGNPLWLGAYLAMLVPIAAQQMNESGSLKTEVGKINISAIPHLLSLILILVCLVLTLSRSAWVALLTGMAVYLFGLRKERIGFRPGFVLILFVLSLLMFAPARQRIAGLFQGAGDPTNLGRLEGWKIGGKILVKRPWFGTGPDTFSVAFRKNKTLDYVQYTGQGKIQGHAHNDIVQFSATTGLLGLGAYLWIGVTIFYLGFRIRNRGMSGALFSSIVVYFAQNQFNFATASTVVLFAIFTGMFFVENGFTKERIIGNPLPASFAQTAAGLFATALCVAAYYLVKPVLADISFQQGKSWSGSDSLLAFQKFETAVKLNPRVPAYINELGNLCRSEANKVVEPIYRRALLKKAIDFYQMNLNQHPYDADGYSNMGVALMWMTQLAGDDQREMAKKCFERACQLDPTFAEFWAHRARVEHFYGNLKEEIGYWENTLALNPDHEAAQSVLPGLLAELKKGNR